MTETSILPGASPVGDAGNPMVPVPPDADEPSGDNRRRLMILGLIAAIVVIAAAAYLLLHKSSSSSDSGSFTPPAPVPTSATHTGSTGTTTTAKGSTSHGGTKGAKTGTTLPRKSHTALVRDPFHPLVSAPVAGSNAGPSATTAPVSSTTVTPAPQSTSPTVVINPTTPTSGGTPTTGTHGQTTTGAPIYVRLISVQGTHSAIFDVGYAHNKFRRFKVIAPDPNSARGTVFDAEFALLGVQGSTATVQIGDDTPFDLSIREAHSA
jgi:hypothetical protein